MNEVTKIENPLAIQRGNDFAAGASNNALATVASAGEVAKVQAALVMAAQFPRDEVKATEKILNAFQRRGLAEAATYTYGRGGTEVSGLSIRAAEAIAGYWRNLEYGWTVIERKNDESTCKAYVWDLENNVQRAMTFRVAHKVDLSGGRSRPVNSERELYELCANQAARRVRACILALIPFDIQEAVIAQIDATLKTAFEITPEVLKKWLECFAKFGVTRKQIEARIQRDYDAITPAQLVGLSKVYNSLKEKMAKPEDFFPPEEAPARETLAAKAAAAKAETEKTGKEGLL